ncbi:hypothetical protein P280DRAFT_468150 [Massarina eburnea CBS 473.64]|uniref:Uncharacterized protein n=1 Tax=Massarina eburnea CBS 473.64 TaxID=1395130 RepID=A0A6A6S6L9_9PLEO|nr:hypothetical protein P280DRAFT_468150 [Massarina eburnea CBS 473.64]
MLKGALPTALISLLLVASSQPPFYAYAAPTPYDFTDNYKATAPSPEEGPPASANASRNKDILPYQITGLVGGYVITVLFWGILLLTVGRKMRRKTENSPKILELELVTKRPDAVMMNGVSRESSIRSPVPPSPASARSATSWFKRNFRKDKVESPSIQESGQHSPIAESPGSFDQQVLDANRQRAQDEMERLYAAVMDHDRKKSLSQASNNSIPSPTSSHRPSAIITPQNMASHSNPSSPVKAIYPPTYNQNGPPTAPLPSSSSQYRGPNLLDPQEPDSPSRSFLSKKSHTSNASSSSKPRFNLKNLRISGPVQKYPHDRDMEARIPLSPRFYNPGAPPSPPTMDNSPTTPADIEAYERLDEVQPLPRPAPQRTASFSSSNAPTPTTTQQQPRLVISPSANLPLRGYAEPLKSPDLRTTVLDRKRDHLSMTTPKTGVPFTPYSPYMPFTPITPVTPHLITKKERKMAKKHESKARHGRNDMVQSPKDIFGDAW